MQTVCGRLLRRKRNVSRVGRPTMFSRSMRRAYCGAHDLSKAETERRSIRAGSVEKQLNHGVMVSMMNQVRWSGRTGWPERPLLNMFQKHIYLALYSSINGTFFYSRGENRGGRYFIKMRLKQFLLNHRKYKEKQPEPITIQAVLFGAEGGI